MSCTPIPMERSVYFSLDLQCFMTQELRWILAGCPAQESFFRRGGVALCVAAVDRRAVLRYQLELELVSGMSESTIKVSEGFCASRATR